MIRKLVFAVALCLVCSTPAMAAGKVGVANFITLTSQSQAGQEAQKQFQATFGAERSQLEAQAAALNQKVEDFNKQAAALSEKARGERSLELQNLARDLETKGAAFTQRASAFEQNLTSQMQTMLLKASADYAKKNGFDLILDGSAVLYADTSADVTAGLLEEFNKAWKAQGSKFNTVPK